MLNNNKLETLYERLGDLIKTAREEQNVKQELLAEFLDLSRVSISNIEKGKQKIQVHTLLEVAKYLHKDVAEFLHPLNNLLVDTVSPEEEQRIFSGLKSPIITCQRLDDGTKIKEFVNFLKTKNNED